MERVSEARDTYIYVASPYSINAPSSSKEGRALRVERYEAVRAYVAKCLNAGEVVYSPINDNHPISWHHNLPGTWDFWEKVDKAFIRGAYKLRVLQLPGWDKSVGIAAEVAYAKEIGLDVEYVTHES